MWFISAKRDTVENLIGQNLALLLRYQAKGWYWILTQTIRRSFQIILWQRWFEKNAKYSTSLFILFPHSNSIQIFLLCEALEDNVIEMGHGSRCRQTPIVCYRSHFSIILVETTIMSENQEKPKCVDCGVTLEGCWLKQCPFRQKLYIFWESVC